MEKHKYLLLGLTCSLMFVTVVAIFGFRHKTPPKSPSPVNSREPMVQLVLETVYTRCHHTDTVKKEMKTFHWSSYEGWRLKRQDGTVIVLQQEEPSLCSVCMREEYMGTHAGKVVIFHGRPERSGPIKEIFPLNVNELPEAEAHDLEKGIIFHDQREKLQLLEGLSSLKDG